MQNENTAGRKGFTDSFDWMELLVSQCFVLVYGKRNDI